MKLIKKIKEFGGWLNRYEHPSDCCQCDMTFSVYLPAQAETEKLPVVYWLSGLTCTDENVRTKAGAQRYAAELGLIIVMPDTGPRGDDVPDVSERYDLGKGAGFYLNATQQPWVKNYQMFDYITEELPSLVESILPVIPNCRSILGHSMGGHGALICGLKKTKNYQSVSAFSPVCHPIQSPWGKAAFSLYLGDNAEQWKAYDAVELIQAGAESLPIKIDQGSNDEFLAEQLMPDKLVSACKEKGFPLNINRQDGYDHSYHFIASFIGQHLAWHAEHLKNI